MEFLKKLWNDEEGQGMVEYGLIIALVSIAVIAALGFLAGGLGGIFDQITTELGGATE